MTTKVRATCDRCHDAKTRCSRDTPCQGCVESGSVCLYSVSGVLGRPRGTKNKGYRRRTNARSATQGRERARIWNSGTYVDVSSTGMNSPRSCDTPDLPDGEDLFDDATTKNQAGEVARHEQAMIESDARTLGSLDMTMGSDFYVDPSQLAEAPFTNKVHAATSTEGQRQSILTMPPVDAADWYQLQWEGGTGSLDVPSLDADPYSMLPSPSTEGHTTRTEGAVPILCTCVQQLAELLASPCIALINASSESDDTVLSIDKALALAKRGTKVWNDFVACPTCPYNNEGEVKILVLVSVRPITRYLQRLAPRYALSAGEPLDISLSSEANTTSTKERSLCKFGALELDAEESTAVYRVLFLKTLQRLRHILGTLEKMERERKQSVAKTAPSGNVQPGEFDASDGRSICQVILQTLANAVQGLQASLESTG